MNNPLEMKKELIEYVRSLKHKYELSESVPDDYFEPGMMENLDQYWGVFDPDLNMIEIKVDVKGLRYENRTQKIDNMETNEPVKILRDELNQFNSNNFVVHNNNDEDVGNLPADLCNVLAPLFDLGYARITDSRVIYIERLSERSRYARQGVLFVGLKIKMVGI